MPFLRLTVRPGGGTGNGGTGYYSWELVQARGRGQKPVEGERECEMRSSVGIWTARITALMAEERGGRDQTSEAESLTFGSALTSPTIHHEVAAVGQPRARHTSVRVHGLRRPLLSPHQLEAIPHLHHSPRQERRAGQWHLHFDPELEPLDRHREPRRRDHPRDPI